GRASRRSGKAAGAEFGLQHLMRSNVGARGFEPPTSWSQTTRSTKLSYAPASASFFIMDSVFPHAEIRLHCHETENENIRVDHFSVSDQHGAANSLTGGR